ncbi:hypothetical protein [Amycolatopsis sp. 195334CR]|uniref:hypothetical protein n=1 Tax=Amycolatopsis sp. 195334CR TaxID=2814588 RepID=UPI001A8DD7C9|nr:hypothetical protein [Amycolatopsis sp. 195334CR]MBN6034137.1 hypothetical protein [Amycolatopsis sp. 195334CR]
MRARVTEAMDRLSAQALSDDVRVPSERPSWRDDNQGADLGVAVQKTPGRRRVLLTAGAAVVAVAAGTLAVGRVLNSPGHTTSTPPLLQFSPAAVASDPGPLLRDLASRARRQAGPSGSGEVFFSERSQWIFATKIDTNGQDLGSQLYERRIQTWLAADGTGREMQSPEGEGPPPMERPLVGQSQLPGADQQALVAGFRKEGQGQPAAWWMEATLRWGAQLHAPATAAAFLDVLAEQPGLTVEGQTTDRRGRAAVAVSAVSHQPGNGFPDSRNYLLIAPETGQLLATEFVATTANSEILGTEVPVPATIGYLLWDVNGLVANLDARP